jgi:2,6-dihydroxypseudooxynicotine hydrolase
MATGVIPVEGTNWQKCRMIADGVPFEDLETAVQRGVSGDRPPPDDSWFNYWAERGEEYARLAEEALALGRKLSAGALFWQASLSHHYARYNWHHEPERWEQGVRKQVEYYLRGAPYFDPPAERIDVPFEQFRIPAVLRFPPGRGPFPCIVLLGGLESTKEEGFLFENLLLQRGLATCAIDGPGQGEFRRQTGMRKDFERFTSAVADFITLDARVDPERLGVLGRSAGGYLAVRSAACDPRFKACVAFGALYDLSFWDEIKPATKLNFAFFAGFTDVEAGGEYLRPILDLNDVIEQLRCPLYVQHGAMDQVIPLSQADKLVAGARNVSELVLDVPAEGDHCCHNMHKVARPRMADWLAEKLGGRVA